MPPDTLIPFNLTLIFITLLITKKKEEAHYLSNN